MASPINKHDQRIRERWEKVKESISSRSSHLKGGGMHLDILADIWVTALFCLSLYFTLKGSSMKKKAFIRIMTTGVLSDCPFRVMLSFDGKCQCSAKCHLCNIGILGSTAAMRDPTVMGLTLLHHDIQSVQGFRLICYYVRGSKVHMYIKPAWDQSFGASSAVGFILILSGR